MVTMVTSPLFMCAQNRFYSWRNLNFNPVQRSWSEVGYVCVYWFHLIRPSTRLWTESCPLCIFHNTCRILFIFAQLINQRQRMCCILTVKRKSKISVEFLPNYSIPWLSTSCPVHCMSCQISEMIDMELRGYELIQCRIHYIRNNLWPHPFTWNQKGIWIHRLLGPLYDHVIGPHPWLGISKVALEIAVVPVRIGLIYLNSWI